MDEREEGEISLDDVSSSEETGYNWSKHRTKSNSRKIKHEKRGNKTMLLILKIK